MEYTGAAKAHERGVQVSPSPFGWERAGVRAWLFPIRRRRTRGNLQACLPTTRFLSSRPEIRNLDNRRTLELNHLKS